MSRFCCRPLTVFSLSLLLAAQACKVDRPGKVESLLAQKIKHSISVKGKDRKNPFPPTDANIAEGRRIFAYYCVACHGLDGQSTGVPFADQMSPPVPSLKSDEVQSYTDGQLKWVIENGVSPSGMPGANSILGDDEMWLIVQYIRHLPEKGSLGEPAFYSGSTTPADGAPAQCNPTPSPSQH